MRVLVLFGGRSGEHEVSVTSARLVVAALTELGHDAVCVGITRDGRWVKQRPDESDRVNEGNETFTLAPMPGTTTGIDVVFPVLHGPNGEDGSLQGLFELADLPYVGAGVEGSAIGINKITHKKLFAQAGLPVVDFVAFTREEWTNQQDTLTDAIDKLGYPSFAKPARLGSSVGISKIHERNETQAAVQRALTHDDDVLIEAQGFPREIEVGVLGEPPDVSVVGEVIPDGEFYDYRAKYLGDWTELHIPADVPSPVERAVRDLAIDAFRTARCEGFARIDFFFDPATEALQINEINTVPGMTPNSMFPRVWEASGKPFSEVVRTLLVHALGRHERKRTLEAARAAAHEDEITS